MSPAFQNNDYVLAFHYFRLHYQVGDVIVTNHPNLGIIIKRIKRVQADHILLEGDNPQSIDSEKMGWISQQEILGKVIFRFASKSSQSSLSN